MMATRRESAGLRAYVQTSRSVIRVIAAVLALFGLILIFNEILEQTLLCDAGACTKIHIGPMIWGIALTILGCLILQKGDVSVSVREMLSAGRELVRIRADLLGRRGYDRANTTLAPVSVTVCKKCGEIEAKCTCPDPELEISADADKDEAVERPRFPAGGIS